LYWSPPPDWSKIFESKPQMNPPGYQETLSQVREGDEERELQRLRSKMKEIHKEKISYRNKNRGKSSRAREKAPKG
jgi:hypothetical protein